MKQVDKTISTLTMNNLNDYMGAMLSFIKIISRYHSSIKSHSVS